MESLPFLRGSATFIYSSHRNCHSCEILIRTMSEQTQAGTAEIISILNIRMKFFPCCRTSRTVKRYTRWQLWSKFTEKMQLFRSIVNWHQTAPLNSLEGTRQALTVFTRTSHLVLLALPHLAILGLQLAVQVAMVCFLLLQLFLVGLHLELELGVPLLQAATGHITAFDLPLQLSHLFLQDRLVGRGAPVVEGQNGNDQQQGHKEKRREAAAPPVGPKPHHGGGQGGGHFPLSQRLKRKSVGKG